MVGWARGKGVMTQKRKTAAARPEMVPPARKGRPKIVLSPVPQWSEQDVDEKLEQIRVRGVKLSADIKALMAQVSPPSA